MLRTYKCLAVVCCSLLSLSMYRPPELTQAECPTIMIDCGTDLVEPDQPFKVTVTVSGADPNRTLSYNWSTSVGTIVSGQGTPTIIIRNPKPHCQTTTATVEVTGLDPSCQKTASCTMVVDVPPVSRKVDEYGALAFKDEKARLDKFAALVKYERGSRGYILFYRGRRTNAGNARRRAERDKMYLVKTDEIESARIMTIDGGERDAMTIELWITPQGAAAPPDFVSPYPPCP